jgi:hypothetical protein
MYDDRQLLFRAYTRAYEKEGKLRTARLVVDSLLATAGVVLALFEIQAPWVGAVSLAWLAGRELPFFTQPDAYRRQAVKIQEEFDCSYPGLVWNDALNGPKEQPHKVRDLAVQTKVDLDSDYWVDTSALPESVGALLRQAQSALWGQEGHERYWKLNGLGIALLIGGLVALSWALGLDTRETIISILVPVTPLIVGRIQAARRHREESSERKDMARTIETELNALVVNRMPSPNFVQAMQGRLYRSRLTGGRIPQWLYDRYKKKDQASIDTWLADQAAVLAQKLRHSS